MKELYYDVWIHPDGTHTIFFDESPTAAGGWVLTVIDSVTEAKLIDYATMGLVSGIDEGRSDTCTTSSGVGRAVYVTTDEDHNFIGFTYDPSRFISNTKRFVCSHL
jgi:hypothetical protein